MDQPGRNDQTVIPAWIDGHLQPADKIAVHRRGDRHMAVSVFVMVSGDILLQRRALGKYHTPGLWANSCCTHPHWAEAPADCALRRVQQELGLTLAHVTHRGQIEYRADVGNGMVEHELVDVFAARLDHRPALAPDPAEVMETRWVALNALVAEVALDPARFTPWLRIYLDEHRALVTG